jgi:hypothetical protein
MEPREKCVFKSADGERELALPQEAFDALWDLIKGQRSGSAVFQVRHDGGVAGVRKSHLVVTADLQYK